MGPLTMLPAAYHMLMQTQPNCAYPPIFWPYAGIPSQQNYLFPVQQSMPAMLPPHNFPLTHAFSHQYAHGGSHPYALDPFLYYHKLNQSNMNTVAATFQKRKRDKKRI